MQSGTAQYIGNAGLAHGRAESLQPPDEVGDEGWEPVDRLGCLDKSFGAFFVEATHPGRNGCGCHAHVFGGLLQRPAAGGPQFENGQSLHRLIVRPAMAGDALHAGILEAHLLAEKVKLLAKAVDLGRAAGMDSMVTAGLGTCRGQSELRQRDGVQDGGADTPIPLPW
jgi:hypothetical protein